MTTFVTSSLACNHFPMNNSMPPFDDRNVRQAMMYAIDRDSIVEDLWQGLSVKATTNFSPALAYYHDDSEVTSYEYDPDMAAQLLEEAGWTMGDSGVRQKDGQPLTWNLAIIAGDQTRRPEAEAVQQWLFEIGCDPQIVESTSITQSIMSGENQMGLYNWTYGGSGGDPDPSSTLHSEGGSNHTSYSNPEMDELINQGLAETDPEARREIYVEVQKLVTEDVPFLFIQYWDWFNFFNPRIKGLPEEEVLSGSTLYNLAHTFWIEESS